MLSLLLGARHEDGSPMSDRELRDELITLLAAGHETTATALAWAFERLLRNPARATLRAEVDAGEDEYLDAVVKETLRVRPVIVDVARALTRRRRARRLRVPAGTIVVPAIALVHDPEASIRTRRVPARALPRRPARAATPGSRSAAACGAAWARRFAQFEIRTVMQTVLAQAHAARP